MSTPPEYWWEEPWKDWGWWIGVISTALVIWMCVFFCWHERHRFCGREQPAPIPLTLLVLALLGLGLGDDSHIRKTGRSEPYHQIWSNNTYVRDIDRFSSMLNLSECWVCMHIPPQFKKPGILLHSIPINESFRISNLMSDGRTYSPPVFLSLMEQAPRCLRFNHNSSNFLGHYPYCNWTYEYINGSSCFQKGTSIYDAMCVDFYTWFTWMTARSRSNCLLQSDLWLLCGTRAYKEIPSAFSGTCTLGVVVPLVYKMDKLPTVRLRNKRDAKSPINQYTGTAISRSLLPPLGVAMNYRDLHRLANWTEALFNSTISALKAINKEMSEIREVVLQNRYALDVVLASKGGVCALIHSHCCMYISDQSANISATINHMETMIAENPLKATGSDAWGWMYSWLPDGSWLRNVIVLLAGPLLILLLLCLCIPCLLQCLQQMMQRLLSRKLGPTVIAVMREYRPIPQNEPKY
ncbi:syncytin-1-like [Podarcis muralis]